MTAEILIVDDPRPGVRCLTLNRPEKRNALATPLLERLAEALAAAETDDTVGCVVLTGGPEVFAAGADINELVTRGPVDAELDPRSRYWGAVRGFRKPVVGAINGYCLGGGLELALSADILIAGEGAQLGTPEINLGIMPGGGGTQWLPRLVGKSVAMKMVLAGSFLSAQEAREAGLVAEVVPDGETIERALALAERIAAKAPLALRIAKEAVLRAYQLPLSEGLVFEQRGFALLLASEDKAEGTSAFLEKRKPSFKGR